MSLTAVLLFICFLGSVSASDVVVTKPQAIAKPQISECAACWEIATTALESWLEIFLYGGTFAGCADFCTQVEWGYGCIAVCSILGDEAFFYLLNATDLDPVYICQVMGVCPIDDCGPVCGVINNVTANPGSIEIPPQDHDYVTLNVTYTLTKKWFGTGVIYYQMVQCDGQNCVFLANNFFLLEPNGALGTFSTVFYFQYDCPVEFYVDMPIQAQMFLCNGNCDEYGVARHPHSALYSTGTTQIQTDGGCP